MEGVQGGDGLGDQNGPCPHREDPLLQEWSKTSEVGKLIKSTLFHIFTLLCDRGVERIKELQETTIIVRENSL